jgi:hypothetical protein
MQVRSSNTASLFKAAWAAYGLLWLISTMFTTCFWLAALGGLPVWWLGLPAIVLGSCALHEVGHLLAAKILRTKCKILAAPGYMAITYANVTPSAARLITFGGPALTVAVYLGAFWLVAGTFLKFVLVATAAAHLLSLLPFTADGRTIWKYGSQTISN